MTAIWESEQFVKPAEGWPADGVIASSNPFTAAPNSTGVHFTVDFEEMLPDGNVVAVGYTLQAVIEEQLSADPAVYSPIAAQFNPINNNNTKGKQIVILTPNPVFDQGVPENLSVGESGTTAQINRVQGDLPPTYRLCIVRNVTDPVKPDLDEMTISAYSRETE